MSHRRDKYTVKFPTNGTANEIGELPPLVALRNIAIQVDGEFTADVALEVKLAPELSFVELTTVSTPSFLSIPNDAPIYAARLVISNYVDGAVVAVAVGRTAQD